MRGVFTGIVEAVVPLAHFERRGGGARLVVRSPFDELPKLGDSVAVLGCCLTVAEQRPAAGGGVDLVFDLSAETLAVTRLGGLAVGAPVNLERALRIGDRLGGHLVSGHVDAVGRVASIAGDRSAGWTFRFEVPAGFERFLVAKGSVTIDGISLTVVNPTGRTFEVAVIPVTFDGTTLGRAKVGDPVHLEADQVGKWIDRLLTARG
jgi:riboflavin synthase